MTDEDRGVLLFDTKEPQIHGYLIIDGQHYQLVGQKVSDIRTILHVRKIIETQDDLFNDRVADKWRDLGAVRQAALRCKEPTFWAYLREEEPNRFPVTNEIDAAHAVRMLCDVASRADLNKIGNHEKRERWHQLDNAYQAWKARENG